MGLKALLGVLALSIGLQTAGAWAQAENYPEKPIKLIVPFAAGGGNDVVARALATQMTEILGQNVLVENIPGASGSIGVLAAARAAPDGYTLVYGNITSVAINAVTIPNLAYDPLADLASISLVTSSHMAVVVTPDTGVTNVDELVEYLKQHPSAPYGTAGRGSPQHLIGELLSKDLGLTLSHVPYNGGGPLTTALLGAQVKVGIGGMTNFISHNEAGTLRIVAIGSAHRSKALPDIPTLAETFPDIISEGWGSLHAPAGTDPAILEKVRGALHRAMETDAVAVALSGAGLDANLSTGEELQERIRSDIETWRKLVDSGVDIGTSK